MDRAESAIVSRNERPSVTTNRAETKLNAHNARTYERGKIADGPSFCLAGAFLTRDVSLRFR